MFHESAPICFTGPVAWPATQRIPKEHDGPRGVDRALRAGGRRAPRPACCSCCRGSTTSTWPRRGHGPRGACARRSVRRRAGEELALLAAALARLLVRRRSRPALERAELALDIAEPQGSARAPYRLAGKGAVAESRGIHEEAVALHKHALTIALEHDLNQETTVLYFALSDLRSADRTGTPTLSITSTRRSPSRRRWVPPARVGDRQRTYPLFMLGRWDEALALADEESPGAVRVRRPPVEPAPIRHRGSSPAGTAPCTARD